MGNHRRKKSNLKASSLSPADLITASPTSSSSSSNDHCPRRISSNTIDMMGAPPIDTATPSPSTSSLRSKFEDILVLVFVFLGFASLSVFVGVAAGISISIHYFDSLEFDQRHLLMAYLGKPGYGPPGLVHQKVTTSDHTISHISAFELEALARGSVFSLGRVIHTNPSGRKSIMMVVDEADTEQSLLPPLPTIQRHEDWVSVPPKLCSDGHTMGYDSWSSLRAVLKDTNKYSAERYERWKEYFAYAKRVDNPKLQYPLTMDDDSLYYEEEIVINICPNTVVSGIFGPLLINTESLVLQCEGCTIDVWGSHLSFGPTARNVIIRGITFRHATSTSLLFPFDGADVSFENCNWISNAATKPTWGAVADLNSSSSIHFYRCFVSKPGRSWGGAQASSLSIRQP